MNAGLATSNGHYCVEQLSVEGKRVPRPTGSQGTFRSDGGLDNKPVSLDEKTH